MRVLVLHSRYASGEASGENQVVAAEVNLLRSGGHEVMTWQPEIDSDTANGNRSAERFTLGSKAIWSASARTKLTHLSKEFRPDIVHVHNLFPLLSPAILKAARTRSPVVMSLHNYRLMCLPATLFRAGKICTLCVGKVPWRGVVLKCYRNSILGSGALCASLSSHRLIGSFQSVSVFAAVSHMVRRAHLEAGLPAERIIVKPHFCEPAAPRRGGGDYFLYLGRLAKEKGILELTQSWRPEFGPLLIAGDGPLRKQISRFVAPSVRLLGQVESDRAAELIRNARAVLVPSLGLEAFGRVVVEAYATRVPVIASDIGALSEIVEHGVTGYLAPPGDFSDWRRSIIQMKDDRTSMRLGEGGFSAWRDRFSPEAGLSGLEAVYHRALSVGR